ncbi:hypothetical protein [Massilia cavernae]|uniref:Glycosyltransferase RgtA/B/C/D-like domain-containing protein n=1 Tax=Massilia cavernae TaxID=2320864 RepID=A0A418XSW5_9BURK|nr:hypothetical protein [Massilia cavernae]RJG15717.1 hypothetical protein D3872_12490 [Massilia cavernae]
MNLFSRAWHFPLTLALLLAALFVTAPPEMQGDLAEYAVTTVAIATHGSADIRLEDIARARELVPVLKEPYALLEAGMRQGSDQLYAAFTRGREAKVYAIHFWGYPALAAGPFKLLDALGQDPFKAFQAVNLAAVFILGLALNRLFRSAPKALLGVGLFMLCGGALYMNWSSPECLSAAALLAGLAFYASGAPLAGAMLAGLAGQQNPTILFFFGFAPLLHLILDYDARRSFGANLAHVLQRRYVLGLAAGMAVFALPPLFNLYQFGVPNIIAKLFSDPSMIGRARLHSFFFDLSQGMILGIPGLVLALALWGWRKHPAGAARELLVLGWAVAFMLALAVPALAVLNWNSGAAGVMRYAFWAAMPLLFVLFLRLSRSAQWPAWLMLAVVMIQSSAMLSAASYLYVEFSPLAKWVMTNAPRLYHPEPEIFAERLGRNDDYIQNDKIYVRAVNGVVVQTLYNSARPDAERRLCGAEGTLTAANHVTASARLWRYIDGPVTCTANGTQQQQTWQYEQFAARAGVTLASGWGNPENGGGAWNGVWSHGARSRVTVKLAGGARPSTLLIVGHYFDGNARTRIRIDGADFGWHVLTQDLRLPLPAGTKGKVEIALEHEAPRKPDPADPREMAFFLREITLR